MKTLVVYYSRSGNTRRVAEMIAQRMGADVQELVDRRTRKGLMGWLRSGRDAIKGESAELEPLSFQPREYDLIVLGTPVWASHPAPATRTFLTSQDLSGKKVALFCTMNAQGGEKTCAVMKELLAGAELAGTLAVAMKKRSADQIRERIDDWATQLVAKA
jgi:flavodoxin